MIRVGSVYRGLRAGRGWLARVVGLGEGAPRAVRSPREVLTWASHACRRREVCAIESPPRRGGKTTVSLVWQTCPSQQSCFSLTVHKLVQVQVLAGLLVESPFPANVRSPWERGVFPDRPFRPSLLGPLGGKRVLERLSGSTDRSRRKRSKGRQREHLLWSIVGEPLALMGSLQVSSSSRSHLSHALAFRPPVWEPCNLILSLAKCPVTAPWLVPGFPRPSL